VEDFMVPHTCYSGTDEMAETAAHNDPEHIVQAHQNNGGQLKKNSRLVHSYTGLEFRKVNGGSE
jgi:hypothetical protein